MDIFDKLFRSAEFARRVADTKTRMGVGLPPSWTGGNSVTGLRADSDLEIKTGMSFHILSWLMGTGAGDDFLSNTVLLAEGGAEVLTRTPAGPIVI